jgi:hypothetical protein
LVAEWRSSKTEIVCCWVRWLDMVFPSTMNIALLSRPDVQQLQDKKDFFPPSLLRLMRLALCDIYIIKSFLDGTDLDPNISQRQEDTASSTNRETHHLLRQFTGNRDLAYQHTRLH